MRACSMQVLERCAPALCILHTARSLVFVLADAHDATAVEILEPEEQTAGEEAADNIGNDSDSSEDLSAFQVPRQSLINTKRHTPTVIGRRK